MDNMSAIWTLLMEINKLKEQVEEMKKQVVITDYEMIHNRPTLVKDVYPSHDWDGIFVTYTNWNGKFIDLTSINGYVREVQREE